ncbi:MAG: short-chain dehydrogenase [Acidimicrobiales bacterium]|nr:MAG: short-chain dehydrogenase [Acidimicrobiales bacterium]
MELQGRTAVVTGAASGIGKAISLRCLEKGMRLVAADVEQPALEEACAEFTKIGEVEPVVCDVSEEGDVARLAEVAHERFGDVHLLVNNAGVAGGTGWMWELTPGDWQWAFGVNLWGVVLGIRHFLPRMLERGVEGHVVNVASLAGLMAPPFMGPYTATKHAVVAISESLHHELRLRQAPIRVSVLCPAFVRTRIHESERNRPEHLRDRPPDSEQGFGSAVMGRALVESGSDPGEIADHVISAVEEGRFWVLPHREPLTLVEQRVRSMLEGGDPPSPFGGFAGG